MRKLVIIFATLVVGSLILSAGSSAQRRGMSGERMYHPQTVETISGVVVSVGELSYFLSNDFSPCLKGDPQ